MMMGSSSAVGGSSSRRMLKLTASILSILFVMMNLLSNPGGRNDNDIDSTNTMHRQLFSLKQLIDTKSTNLRMGIQNKDEKAKKLLEEQVWQKQANLIQEADRAISHGNVAFRVHAPGEEERALFTPSELLIEVVNPNPNNQYSVTVTSLNKYTGTAMLLRDNWTPEKLGYQSAISQNSLVYYWKPIFPEQYDILVHEIDPGTSEIDRSKMKTPKIAPGMYPIIVNEGEQSKGVGVSMLQDRIENMPPCQSQTNVNAFSQWDGQWLGPDFALDNSIRTGWSFLPSSESMNCKVETFDTNDIRSIPKKKSIYVLGTSIQRGIFLSLVDIMLDNAEKEQLSNSVIQKCWGRMVVQKGNLEVLYQDFRPTELENPDDPPHLECHNDKIVKDPESLYRTGAAKVWEEIFQQDEANWPNVIYADTRLANFEQHALPFVKMLPPNWQGTLFFDDVTFNGLGMKGGLVGLTGYERYLNNIKTLVTSLGDPRVRWIDGVGVSKEMRMYGEFGEDRVALSQHFHRPCTEIDMNDPSNTMVVCSNVTEIMGQLLLGHALGPKDEFKQQVEESNPDENDTSPNYLRWCHHCPKSFTPFRIVPYPILECVEGPLEAKVVVPIHGRKEEKCPDSCLAQTASRSFPSQSDTVYVRQCLVE